MIRKLILASALMLFPTLSFCHEHPKEKFPDGTPIPAWFYDASSPEISKLGKKYVITDYDVINDSTIVQTERIQAVIDRASSDGGLPAFRDETR